MQLGGVLKDKGYDVTYLTFYETEQKCDYRGKHICFGYEEEKNALSDAFEIIHTSKKIKDICTENNIDILISFLTRMNVQSILSKSLFRNKVKILVSVRNNPIKRNKTSHQKLIKMLYPKADKVVAQTRGIENILNEKFSTNNTTVIPNMADLTDFKRLAKKDVSKEHEVIFDNDFTFITIGSLTEQKAQWYLVRCFKRLTRIEQDSTLIILGKGPLERKLKDLVKEMKIEDKILFLGEVKNVFPYLRRADCFVLTSLYEGFPNVLIEAISQDLPTISTDCISGPREILCPGLTSDEEIEYPFFGKFGILTKPFRDSVLFKTLKQKSLSEEETILFKLMKDLKDNEKYRKPYSSASRRVKDFDRDKIVEQWEELF
ncbi:MAG: glycosyltransferase [Candidatus Saliniplasma sp.]